MLIQGVRPHSVCKCNCSSSVPGGPRGITATAEGHTTGTYGVELPGRILCQHCAAIFYDEACVVSTRLSDLFLCGLHL